MPGDGGVMKICRCCVKSSLLSSDSIRRRLTFDFGVFVAASVLVPDGVVAVFDDDEGIPEGVAGVAGCVRLDGVADFLDLDVAPEEDGLDRLASFRGRPRFRFGGGSTTSGGFGTDGTSVSGNGGGAAVNSVTGLDATPVKLFIFRFMNGVGALPSGEIVGFSSTSACFIALRNDWGCLLSFSLTSSNRSAIM